MVILLFMLLLTPADTTADARHVLVDEMLDLESGADDFDLAELLTTVFDINRASARDLARIPGITESAIDTVLARRRQVRFGRHEEIADLNLDDLDRRLLLAFTRIEPEASRKRPIRSQTYARWSKRLEPARGYDDSSPTYLGPPYRIQSRSTVSSHRFAAAITLDKPAGAKFEWSPEENLYGFDRVHGFVSVSPGDRFQITIGDFRSEYGQGLTVWSGASFGRGREPVRGVMRTTRGINGTASTMDDRILRGAAISVNTALNLTVDAFVSSRRLDAAIDTLYTDHSFQTLARRLARSAHRTQLEFERRNTLRERSVGGAVTYASRRVSVGLVGLTADYAHPLSPGDRPDTRYATGGRRFHHAGLHGTLRLDGADVFAETSLDGYRALVGVRLKSQHGAELVAALRTYSARSENPFAAGFASRTYPMGNERGGYIGARIRLSASTTLHAFADVAHHPWLRYQIPRPTVSSDQFVELRHRPRPWWDLSISGRRRSIDTRLATSDMNVATVHRVNRQSVRIDTRLYASSGARLHGRVERSMSSSEKSPPASGHLIYQELWVQVSRRADLTTRITHFQIDGFDARIYAYERDVVGAFTTHMHTGSGRRAYILLNLRVFPELDLQTRLARTWMDDVDTMGTGAAAVDGNTLTDVTVLFRHRI